ncbi:MAG: hypothetical protein OXI61_02100 [Candidatus Poribacteria bacterium]|nr:hypothetical protein [Candidatus Poribacteria bacterium]
MNLLEDIQNAAADSSSNVGTLLRKCKILAARLNSQQLEDWITWESNGYPEDIPVPSYRVWPLEVKGHFSGPFGSGLRNAPIPTVLLPENVRECYNKYQCRLSIAVIESAIEENKGGMLQVPTGNLAVILGTNVYENMNCLQCWAEFGVGSLVEVLNAGRNRVLDFSLALWKENPTAGETNSTIQKSLSPEKITQIFNTTVHSGTANLLGTANNSSVDFNIGLNDFESVRHALKNNNVSEEDIAELKKVLAESERPQSANQFSPKVNSWIAGMVKKTLDGTWNIGVGAAGELLADVISKFYGL